MNAVPVLDRPRGTRRLTCSVSSASLLRRYKTGVEEESVRTRISKLEMRIDHYTQSTWRSLLTPDEIEEITRLSETSLQNIATIQRLAKQIQETSNGG